MQARKRNIVLSLAAQMWQASFMNVNETVRQRIGDALQEKGLTARKWSVDAGLGPNFVQQFLGGDENRTITVENLEALGRVIGWEPTDFLSQRLSGLNVDLLAAVLGAALRTVPEPLANSQALAEVVASTYERAHAFGLSPADSDQIRFGLELLAKEAPRRSR